MDVTDRKRMEAELERLALYDSLTGLPNRALFSDRLDQAIAHRSRTQAIAVYFLDVDRFKRINDSLGHAAGDEVLREVAARIQRMLRPEDTVARFGGDEFTILCESIGGVLEAVGVADRLQREIAQPLRAGGAELRLSASIGIAMAEPGEDADGTRGWSRTRTPRCTARRSAAAPAPSCSTWRCASARWTRSRSSRSCRAGSRRGELRLYYQPLVSLNSPARWSAPRR